MIGHAEADDETIGAMVRQWSQFVKVLLPSCMASDAQKSVRSASIVSSFVAECSMKFPTGVGQRQVCFYAIQIDRSLVRIEDGGGVIVRKCVRRIACRSGNPPLAIAF